MPWVFIKIPINYRRRSEAKMSFDKETYPIRNTAPIEKAKKIYHLHETQH